MTILLVAAPAAQAGIFDAWKQDAKDLWNEVKSDTSSAMSDAADRAREKASEWGDDVDRRVQETKEKARDKAAELGDRVSEKTSKVSQDMKEKGRKVADEAAQRVGDSAQRLSETAQRVQREWEPEVKAVIKEKARDISERYKARVTAAEAEDYATYKDGARSVARQELRRQLSSDYADPATAGKLEARRGLLSEGAMAVIKILPCPDPDGPGITTFDRYARDLTDDPAFEGTDLGRDPVRATFLMMWDEDYYVTDAIIPHESGQSVSLVQAYESGYRREQTAPAMESYLLAKEAYERNDQEAFEHHLSAFSSRMTVLGQPTPPILFAAAIPGALLIGAAILLGRPPKEGAAAPAWTRRW